MPAQLFKAKDNATGNLDAGISASALSILLEAGDGANFPQPYTGTASSAGSRTVLNDTGDLASLAVGDFIRNVTDGSWAFVKTAGTNSITTTRLQGGSDNTWDSADTWRVNEFVLTLAKIDIDGDDTQTEQVLISNRTTDTLVVPTGGRGFNGTTAQAFDAADYAQLRVTAPHADELRELLKELQVDTDLTSTTLSTLSSDLASTANTKGASMIGVEDSATNFTGDNVEEVLAELFDAIPTTTDPFIGDGSDGALNVASGTTNIDAASANIVVKEYTSLTVAGGATLGLTNPATAGTILILRVQGNVDISGTIDLRSCGATGGTAVTSSVASAGNTDADNGVAGTNAFNNIGQTRNGGAGNGAAPVGAADASGGAGGASVTTAGSSSSAAGTAGAATGGTAITSVLAALASGGYILAPGAGGGSGGAAVRWNSGGTGPVSATSGAGGRGAGALFIICGGTFSFTGTINLSGGDATAASKVDAGGGGTFANAAAGGGGGGAGVGAALSKGAITNSGTVTATAGAATNATSNAAGLTANASNGAAGAAGSFIVIPLAFGT